MKNKTKRAKIAAGKNKNENFPKEWLYLCTQEVSPRQIAELFRGREKVDAQLWEEAGVVELGLFEAKSIDMELLELPTGETEFDTSLEEEGIACAYLVTLVPADEKKAMAAMKIITENLGGYFCGDNDKREPVVK